jgi:hypothetical protein
VPSFTLVLAVVALVLAPVRARATTFVGMTEHTLARAADAIVVGTVTNLESVATRDGAISTLVTVEVEREYKGRVGRVVTLRQPGGRVGDRGLWIAGSPRFTRGERQLLFLSAHHDGTARTTALGLGQFVLTPHARTAETLAERRLDGLVLGRRPLRRVRLARLLATIRRALAVDPGATAPLVTVPSEVTEPGLPRENVDAFTLMDSPSGRWFEADRGQPVHYEVDERGDGALGSGPSLAAVDAALAAWTNVTGASIVLARGGAASPAPLRCDGLSQIIFDDPFREMPNPVRCSGVLALGGYCTSAESEVVNGTRFFRITEGNITFNQGFGGCSFWSQTNLAEVATHELGHTIGIGHTSETDSAPPDLKDATMYYRAHFDGRGASVHAEDVAAVRFVYPGPDGEGGPDDSDADGRPDAEDNCAKLPNAAQTDTDGDAAGDLCDPCPLVAGEGAVCDPIFVSRLKVRMRGHGRLVWTGAIDLPEGIPASAARVLLVNADGVVVDTAMGNAIRRGGPRPRNLRYRSDRALITLRAAAGGSYRVRVAVRGVELGSGVVPLISASLQVGSASFADSLSCSHPRGRRLRCSG